MLRMFINSLWSAANTLSTNNQNVVTPNPSPTSKWRLFRNFIFATMSTVGLPLVQSLTQTGTVYEYVNTLLSTSTTNHNNNVHDQRHNSNLNRHSRPNFRRRSHRHHGTVRIIKPTIHVHIH